MYFTDNHLSPDLYQKPNYNKTKITLKNKSNIMHYDVGPNSNLLVYYNHFEQNCKKINHSQARQLFQQLPAQPSLSPACTLVQGWSTWLVHSQVTTSYTWVELLGCSYLCCTPVHTSCYCTVYSEWSYIQCMCTASWFVDML